MRNVRKYRRGRRNASLHLCRLILAVCGIYTYGQTGNMEMTVFVMVAILALVILFGMLRQGTKKYMRKRYFLGSSYCVIDQMEGHEFEDYLIAHFGNLGYRCRNVGGSGHDYGVDLLITKEGKTTAVQAKRYRERVGVKAVQEIVSGMHYYRADKAMVVTNSYFTRSAIEMAEKCNVVLWNRDVCKNMFKIVG